MDTQEKIKTWKWRIKRLGFKYIDFCKVHNINTDQLYKYADGKVTPKVDTFDKIEGIIFDLEKDKGLINDE